MTSSKTKVRSETADATFETARDFGRSLESGDVVLLYGNLGAGKTVFVKGLAAAFGFDPDDVTSPSFTLVNEYEAERKIYHVDLWRMEESPADIASSLGLDEMLEDENALTVVEWAEKLDGFVMPARVFEVRIMGCGDEPRTISICQQ